VSVRRQGGRPAGLPARGLDQYSNALPVGRVRELPQAPVAEDLALGWLSYQHVVVEEHRDQLDVCTGTRVIEVVRVLRSFTATG
jgi:hypothetical protein